MAYRDERSYEDDLNDLAKELEDEAGHDAPAASDASVAPGRVKKASDEDLPTMMHYFWQPVLSMVFFGVSLFFLNWTSELDALWSGSIAALAASSFYVFSLPKARANVWWVILGSYVFAIVFGELVYLITHYVYIASNSASPVPYVHVFELFAWMAILVGSWIMLALRLLHAPAIGLMITMIYQVGNDMLLFVVCLAVLFLVILKVIFSPWLKDL